MLLTCKELDTKFVVGPTISGVLKIEKLFNGSRWNVTGPGEYNTMEQDPDLWEETAADGYVPNNPYSVDMYYADVNGDGRDDLVGRDPSNSQVLVALSNGTGFSAQYVAAYWA